MHPAFNRVRALAAVFLLFPLPTNVCVYAAASYATIALTGKDGQHPFGPHMGDGIEFSSLSVPSISQSGAMAFSAFINTPSSNAGIWTMEDGNLELAVRNGPLGTSTGLGPQVHFYQFDSDSILIGVEGQLTFRSSIRGVGVDTYSNYIGVWSGSRNGPPPIARTGTIGELGPGMGFTSNFSTSNFASPVIQNSAGAIAFGAIYSVPDSGGGYGIWTHHSEGLTIAARSNDTTSLGPQLGPDVIFNGFGAPLLNSPGQLAFWAMLGNRNFQTIGTGIWFGLPGSPQPLAYTGALVSNPNVSGNTSFGAIGAFPSVNAHGQIAFRSFLAGPEINEANDSAIWVASPQNLELVARTGSAAFGPRIGEGVVFSGFADPLFTKESSVAFVATLSGSGVTIENDSGIWALQDGALHVVAREGDIAPGTSAGVCFEQFDNLVANKAGQVAFRAKLRGQGVTTSDAYGLWMTDRSGTLHLIARTGDSFDVDSGSGVEMRKISTIGMRGGYPGTTEDGRPTSLNDAGQLAFSLRFSDAIGGIFVATLPIPGDLNQDGAVDVFDVNLISEHWGEFGPHGDANLDGLVDIFDVNMVSDNWTTAGTLVIVAEPSTILLAALALAFIACYQPIRR